MNMEKNISAKAGFSKLCTRVNGFFAKNLKLKNALAVSIYN
jgi:hypothetical protein